LRHEPLELVGERDEPPPDVRARLELDEDVDVALGVKSPLSTDPKMARLADAVAPAEVLDAPRGIEIAGWGSRGAGASSRWRSVREESLDRRCRAGRSSVAACQSSARWSSKYRSMSRRPKSIEWTHRPPGGGHVSPSETRAACVPKRSIAIVSAGRRVSSSE